MTQIIATFLGGPRCGDSVALSDHRQSLNVAVPREDWYRYLPEVESEDITASPTYTQVTMLPELTANGWVLRWREPR